MRLIKITRWEKTLIAVLVISLLLLTRSYMRPEGKKAVLTRNGETIMEIDLSSLESPREWTIKDGEHINTIRAEKGRIRFKDSNCPKGICIKKGWLRRRGDQAICLPHRLVITIEGGEVDGFTK